MENAGERLKWARTERGFASIEAAAKHYRLHKQNWGDHESGRRKIQLKHALAYGKKLRINPWWLLSGEGFAEKAQIPLRGEVGAGATVHYVDDDNIEMIDAPIGAQEGDLAFIVRGDSMGPAFRAGGVLIVRPLADAGLSVNHRAVVDLRDGRRLFKLVIPGSKPGLFTLVSHSGAAPIMDVELERAAKFCAYIEP